MRLASVDAQCSMARSFLNASNNHLASIKCKKTFGGWGSVPDPLGEFAPDSFPRKQAHSTWNFCHSRNQWLTCKVRDGKLHVQACLPRREPFLSIAAVWGEER